MTFLEDAIKRVRDYGASLERSQQQAIGWSEVGGCRAYLGYRLRGEWETDEPDEWAAIRGTAIHALLEQVMGAQDVLTEVTTAYRGIPGHADLVLPAAGQLWDWKSSKLATIQLWQRDKTVLRQKRIQIQGYAAGLVEDGILPEDCTVGLVAIPVDGTFADWWCHEEPFDRTLADEGADRLEWVREHKDEALPKDMPLAWCLGWCPFATACRAGDDPAAAEKITDPELVAAIAEYGEATKAQTALKKQKDGLAAMIRGLRGTAGDWRVSLGQPGDPTWELDEDWVRADYAARGEDVPVVEKPGSAPRLSVTRIKRKAGA